MQSYSVLLPQAKHTLEITLHQNLICLYNLKCFQTIFYLLKSFDINCINQLYVQFINCLHAFTYWIHLDEDWATCMPVQASVMERIVKGIGCGSYRLVGAESCVNVFFFFFFFFFLFSSTSLDRCRI